MVNGRRPAPSGRSGQVLDERAVPRLFGARLEPVAPRLTLARRCARSCSNHGGRNGWCSASASAAAGGGRADEGGGLENRLRGDPYVGSNPTPPATVVAGSGSRPERPWLPRMSEISPPWWRSCSIRCQITHCRVNVWARAAQARELDGEVVRRPALEAVVDHRPGQLESVDDLRPPRVVLVVLPPRPRAAGREPSCWSRGTCHGWPGHPRRGRRGTSRPAIQPCDRRAARRPTGAERAGRELFGVSSRIAVRRSAGSSPSRRRRSASPAPMTRRAW